MGYDRGDSFPLDFEPNVIPFGSKSKGKLSPRTDPIQIENKWDASFLSVVKVGRGKGVCLSSVSEGVGGGWEGGRGRGVCV